MYIFERLALAERAETAGVRTHVAADFSGIGPRILAQRPANRLADEELAVGQVGGDAVEEQRLIGRGAAVELADDARAALPERSCNNILSKDINPIKCLYFFMKPVGVC